MNADIVPFCFLSSCIFSFWNGVDEMKTQYSMIVVVVVLIVVKTK